VLLLGIVFQLSSLQSSNRLCFEICAAKHSRRVKIPIYQGAEAWYHTHTLLYLGCRGSCLLCVKSKDLEGYYTIITLSGSWGNYLLCGALKCSLHLLGIWLKSHKVQMLIQPLGCLLELLIMAYFMRSFRRLNVNILILRKYPTLCSH
jgi:hypothetical protein